MEENRYLAKGKVYYPYLDSLRFLAFLLVFLSHTLVFIYQDYYIFAVGDLGVNIFFVLSGFLITSILVKELKSTKSINLKKFYGKRIRRIWPVYFLTLTIGLLWVIFMKALPSMPNGQPPLWPYLFFFGNYALITLPLMTPILGVLWSISVEEQFYLVWPWLVKFNKKYLRTSLFLIILGSALFRYVNFSNKLQILYGTFSVMNYLAFGGVTALIFQAKAKLVTKHRLKILFSGLTLFLMLLLLRFYLFSAQWLESQFWVVLLPLLFAVAFVCLILGLTTTEKIEKGVRKIFIYLGVISYGLYAYHMVAILALMLLFQKYNLTAKAFLIAGSFILTIIVSTLSYKYLESPILKFKKKSGLGKMEF